MSKARLLIKIVLIVGCIAFANAKDGPNFARDYKKALNQIKSGDLKVDFKALRLDCAASRASCEADKESKRKINSLLDEKKYIEALKKINRALQKAYVDMDLHYFAYVANRELKRKELAEFHQAIYTGLVSSIRDHRFGRTKKDAFVVISAREEEEFLEFNRLQALQRRVINEDNHFYDETICIDMDTRQNLTIYFNLDIPLNNVLNLFSKEK